MAQIALLTDSQLRGVSDVLGNTSGGLSNDDIDALLAEAGMDDPTPTAPPGTYNAINKRTRLFNALKARQDRDRSPNAVLNCTAITSRPTVATAIIASVLIPTFPRVRAPNLRGAVFYALL